MLSRAKQQGAGDAHWLPHRCEACVPHWMGWPIYEHTKLGMIQKYCSIFFLSFFFQKKKKGFRSNETIEYDSPSSSCILINLFIITPIGTDEGIQINAGVSIVHDDGMRWEGSSIPS